MSNLNPKVPVPAVAKVPSDDSSPDQYGLLLCDTKPIRQCVPIEPDVTLILTDLNASLPFPWIVIPGTNGGITALLLSRDQEKSVQRRASFAFDGEVDIAVHRKPILESLKNSVVPDKIEMITCYDEQRHRAFVQNVVSVIRTLQSYEVCVGVDETEFMPLWHIDKYGEVDNNPYGELTYRKTFRPYACHLLVSTVGYLRRRCSICIKTKTRFGVKIQRHKSVIAKASTANIHLDRNQLLSKVILQQKKLKVIRARLMRLKIDLQNALSNAGCNINKFVSEELVKICMEYTKEEVEM